jgi:hypothetical protein
MGVWLLRNGRGPACAVTVHDMFRVVVSVGCALALAGCASWMPSLDAGGGAELRADSDPPGAEARTSTGQGCRTPCAMVVPATDQAVTFTLPGYFPQTVPVQVRLPGDPRADPNAVASVQLTPNPVTVALEPAPPPVAAKRKPAPRRAAPKPPKPT